ncbi:MAG: 4-hydroxythreonine-4-phosphate dehydrogenase PdxA [Armatimonadetes bacterium]|nr:4-hydroxythreonine-4-phosphate dehydrogenase PdxA [Armatimonadota bacterium]MDW8122073.1 4-hydroxythreonine-4-phosphate dehydrogenase PdxA [Armatimonadota bacterium]
MGDPAGIGPEIIVKALRHPLVRRKVNPIVVGSLSVISQAARLMGLEDTVKEVTDAGVEGFPPQVIPVVDIGDAQIETIEPGRKDARYGRIAVQSMESALSLVLSGQANGLVTAPICKESAHLAGFPYPGVTEFLADRCGVKETKLMLWSAPLKVIHTTGHLALKEALKRLTPSAIVRTAELGKQVWAKVYKREPRIAVAAVNPHLGEGGAFGNDDQEIVEPAVSLLKEKGFTVFGPVPADTVFYHARKGLYDIVVAHYHDQGHIPVKLLAFESAVNVTAGLPIVRTSPDHGVAFDIAWQNKAREGSLVRAILLAARLAQSERMNREVRR